MPAPRNPNTAAATAAVKRRGQQTSAIKLGQAGWLAVSPEKTAEMLELSDEELGAFVRAYAKGWLP